MNVATLRLHASPKDILRMSIDDAVTELRRYPRDDNLRYYLALHQGWRKKTMDDIVRYVRKHKYDPVVVSEAIQRTDCTIADAVDLCTKAVSSQKSCSRKVKEDICVVRASIRAMLENLVALPTWNDLPLNSAVQSIHTFNHHQVIVDAVLTREDYPLERIFALIQQENQEDSVQLVYTLALALRMDYAGKNLVNMCEGLKLLIHTKYNENEIMLNFQKELLARTIARKDVTFNQAHSLAKGNLSSSAIAKALRDRKDCPPTLKEHFHSYCKSVYS